MKFNQKSQWMLALITTIVILLSGVAFANNSVNNADVVRIGGDVTVAAKQVVKDATAIGGSVTVLNEGRVTGDAVAIGGDVILQPKARVDGDAVALGGKIVKPAGAVIGKSAVTGSENFRGMTETIKKWGFGGLLARIYLASAAFHLITMLAIAALGALLLFLIPSFIQTLAATVRQDPLRSGLWGLGGAIALILLATLIVGSILGNLLLPIVNLAVLIAGLLGAIAMGLLIGERIAKRSPIAQFLIGILILALIGLIPVVGGLLLLAVNIFGFGAVLISTTRKVRPQLIASTPEPVDQRHDEIEEMNRV